MCLLSIFILLSFILCISKEQVFAAQWYLYSGASARGAVTRGFEGVLAEFVPEDERIYGYVQAQAEVNWNRLGGVLSLGTWEISEDTIESGALLDRTENRLFIDEMYFYYGDDEKNFFTSQIGWTNTVILDGYILDDYYPGGTLRFNFLRGEKQLSLEGYVCKVETDSLISGSKSFISGTQLTYSAKPSGLTLKGGFHVLIERDDYTKQFLNETFYTFLLAARELIMKRLLEKTQNSALAEYMYYQLLTSEVVKEAKADIYWITTRLQWTGENWDFSLLGAIDTGTGRVHTEMPTSTGGVVESDKDIIFFGYMWKGEVSWKFLEWMKASPALLWMSGSADYYRRIIESGRVDAFLSFRPLIYDSAVFFQQGLNLGLHSSAPVTAGLFGTGLVVPQLSFEATLWKRFEVTLSNIGIFTEKKPSEAPSAFIGYEMDFLLQWNFWKDFSLSTELDVFVPGGFFKNTGGTGVMWTLGLDWAVEGEGCF